VEMLSEESGTGTVQLDPPGFVCSGPDPCVFPSYLMGTRVTLTAHPSADSLFVRWGGACAGNGACEVTLSDDVVVRATFGIRNHPPVANAGGPRAGYRNVPVLFDGSSSSDPDGDALTYHWDFGDGATAAGASVTHAYAALGTFDVTLTVSDGNGATSNASTTAVIANRAPVAAAGPDQVVALGQGVTLSAAGSSDPDSDALSYEWRSAGGPVGTTPTVILSLGLGSHDITLTVRDGAGGEASDAVRVVVADTAPPIVVVTAPDGAPVTQGLPYTITWTATDNGAIAGFDVALSTNGGVTFNPLAGCTALAGAARSCVWSSPGPVGASTRLRVTGRDASGNAGSDDSAFPIQAPAIVLTAPNGAQSWGVGSVQRVAWTHNLGAGSLVRVELSRNGGSSWTTIAPSVTNATATAGFFDWTVTGATTTNARVRVVWQANTAINDRSDASFTIASPFVTVTSPNTGVAWTVGTVQTLRWNHNLGTNGVVKVEVSRDGGGAWALIHSGVANNGASTGSFDWTVSGPTTTKGRIRLTWTADPAVTDRSDANFTIR